MSDQGALDREKELREHEEEAAEREPAERSPEARTTPDEDRPAPPGNAEQTV